MTESIIPPIFKLEMLPEEERDSAWDLQCAVGRLVSYVAAFEAAVALFDHAFALFIADTSNRHYSRWFHMAAREGAMTVYHFGRVLLNGCSFESCPALRKLVSTSHTRLARKRFEAKFPNATALRNIVAHDAEAYDTMEKRDMHGLRGSGDAAGHARIVIHTGLLNRSLQTTFEGRIISYDLDEKTLRFLQDTTIQFYRGFEQLERFPLHLRQLIAQR